MHAIDPIPVFLRGTRPVTRRGALHLLGGIAAVAALAWIGWQFAHNGGIELVRSIPTHWTTLLGVVVACAIGYALAASLLALAWWRLLEGLSARTLRAVPTTAAYAVSQFAKYLPGSVANYALRHAMARRDGTSHSSLAVAAVLEAVLLLLTAFSLTLFADLRGGGILSFVDPRIATALLALLLATAVFTMNWMRQRPHVWRFEIPRLPLPMFVQCLPVYAAFFLACTLLQEIIALALQIPVPSFALLLGAVTASWIAGFVVIGAPAGVGVREAAFVALAGPSLGDAHALVLIGLFRIVTFAGDALLLGAGAWFLRRDELEPVRAD